MKVILLILCLVSLLYLLLVNASWSTKASLMHYRAGRLTRTGRMSRFLMELRQLKRTYKNNFSSFKVMKRLSFFSIRTKPVTWRRKQWLRSYRLGKLRLLIYQTRIKMRLTHCKIMMLKRSGKLSGMLRRISRME